MSPATATTAEVLEEKIKSRTARVGIIGLGYVGLPLAVEYAKAGLRCNSVSPGAIDTPITAAFEVPEGANPKLINRVMPLNGFGTPEGIAATIAYVASDEASHMNGADIRVDGATLS